jgi:hypothetical protein
MPPTSFADQSGMAFDRSPVPSRVFGRGFSTIYSIMLVMVICGFVSMGVELGRVQLAKNELAGAIDAAARAGAASLSVSPSQARSVSITIAAANTCDGLPIVLLDPDDIELGSWDPSARTFTVLSGAGQNSANAVRITGHRSASRGTAIPLFFARMIGRDSCDIHAVAIAMVKTGHSKGFVGLNSITLHDRGYFVSYKSSFTATPSLTSASSNSFVSTNGAITYNKEGHIWGDVQLGPSGSVEVGMQVTGSQSTISPGITAPSDPPWAPGINPGGIPQSYTVSSDTILPGGNYWFTSLTLNKSLTFSGPATVYVNGDITISADRLNLEAYNDIPSNLTLYQIGTSRSFSVNHNENRIVAQVQAPGSGFLAHDKLDFEGTAIFATIVVHDDGILYFDETADMAVTSSISVVQ